jgi:hypothetical protein
MSIFDGKRREIEGAHGESQRDGVGPRQVLMIPRNVAEEGGKIGAICAFLRAKEAR